MLALRYFLSSLDASKTKTWKSGNHTGLSFIYLILGDEKSAALNLISANSFRENFLAVDFCSDSPERSAWMRLWSRFQTEDFQAACEKLFQTVAALKQKQRILSQLEEVKRIDPSFDEASFIAGASSLFRQAITGFWNSDRATLIRNVDAAVYGSWSDGIRYREELKYVGKLKSMNIEDATITDVQTTGVEVSIKVTFISDQIAWIENSEGSLVEGDHQKPMRKVDTWTFRRNLNLPGAQWRVSGTQ